MDLQVLFTRTCRSPEPVRGYAGEPIIKFEGGTQMIEFNNRFVLLPTCIVTCIFVLDSSQSS